MALGCIQQKRLFGINPIGILAIIPTILAQTCYEYTPLVEEVSDTDECWGFDVYFCFEPVFDSPDRGRRAGVYGSFSRDITR